MKLSPCVFQFAPTPVSGEVVSHLWQIEENGVVSTTNARTPKHTFSQGNYLAEVTHTVTSFVNGVLTDFTCVQFVPVNCDKGCQTFVVTPEGEGGHQTTSVLTPLFEYEVRGCTLIVRGPAGLWSFGDNTPSVSGAEVTHVYQRGGTYRVCILFGALDEEKLCCREITIDCATPNCCDADFTGEINRMCAGLYLEAYPVCTGGSHVWEIVGSCARIEGPMLQVTNINTVLTPEVQVKHTYTCPNGTTVSVTKTIPIHERGIFIGILGSTTNLTLYECVLPGTSYDTRTTGVPDVYVTGIVRINKNFTFLATTIFMEPGLNGFDVPSGNILTLRDQSSAESAFGCNCLWRGIYVWGQLTTNDAQIKDAVYAVRAYQPSVLSLDQTDFRDNFIGIRVTDGAFTLRRFQSNRFRTTRTLFDICGLKDIIMDVKDPRVNFGVAFQRERGYAGIYARDLPRLNLLAVPLAVQNTFDRLAYGIVLFNTNTQIIRNSRFSNIQGGAYGNSGGSAVILSDSPTNGNNFLRFWGNNLAGTTDFDLCGAATSVFSSVPGSGFSGTRLDIRTSVMSNVGVGVELMGGSFAGNGNNSFKGVYSNRITANQAFIFATAGIYVQDFNPSISALEIRNNNIVADRPGTAYGVAVLSSTANDGTSARLQYDIHDNRIELAQGISAVYLQSGDVWVHDNRDYNNGNGIFVTTAAPTSGTFGVYLNGNSENLVACNDIVSTSGSGLVGAVLTDNHADGQIANNLISGAATGIEFVGVCGTSTVFRCNEMRNAQVGMYYRSAATGPQGSQTDPAGNRWFNNVQDIGRTQGLNTTGSEHYYRDIPNERPANVAIFQDWFRPVSAPYNNVTPNCKISCPVSAGWQAAPDFGDADSLVAEGALAYAQNNAVMEWWHRYNLYQKLQRYPSLKTGNAKAQQFFGAWENSSMAGLARKVVTINQLFQVPEATQQAIQAAIALIDEKSAQLAALDSVMLDTPDSAAQTLLTQIELVAAELAAQQTALATIYQQLQSQIALDAGPILANLEALPTSNTVETNGKTVLRLFLKNAAQGYQLTTSEVGQLYAIAAECPSVGGPVVFWARAVYRVCTGQSVPEQSCNDFGRDNGAQDRTAQAGDAGFWATLKPVPVKEQLYLETNLAAGQDPVSFTVFDHLGGVVAQGEFRGANYVLDVAALLPGRYVLRLSTGVTPPITKAFIVMH